MDLFKVAKVSKPNVFSSCMLLPSDVVQKESCSK